MAYADLRNFFLFRKVFGRHPRVLVGLLNDLLEREGDRVIVQVEYLSSGLAPRVPGVRYSLFDARCRERGGAEFFVEMQMLPVTGFLNRVVFNACKAYVGALERGKRYDTLTDVVAVSICDFTLWPDVERDGVTLPRVPLVSRWRMTERATGTEGIGQVQYVFMELPKLGDHVPGTANERWATLFTSAPDLTPEGMASVPLSDAQREALELAREETFTLQERDAIERAFEEVDQVRRTVLAEAAQAEARGRSEGRVEGHLEGRRSVLRMLLGVVRLEITSADQARIDACAELTTLDEWIRRAPTAASREDVFGAQSAK